MPSRSRWRVANAAAGGVGAAVPMSQRRVRGRRTLCLLEESGADPAPPALEGATPRPIQPPSRIRLADDAVLHLGDEDPSAAARRSRTSPRPISDLAVVRPLPVGEELEDGHGILRSRGPDGELSHARLPVRGSTTRSTSRDRASASTPARSRARTVTAAVTPEPQYTATSASGSTADGSAVYGMLTAPGIWPATGSIGSTSPRYRSGTRARPRGRSPASRGAPRSPRPT